MSCWRPNGRSGGLSRSEARTHMCGVLCMARVVCVRDVCVCMESLFCNFLYQEITTTTTTTAAATANLFDVGGWTAAASVPGEFVVVGARVVFHSWCNSLRLDCHKPDISNRTTDGKLERQGVQTDFWHAPRVHHLCCPDLYSDLPISIAG